MAPKLTKAQIERLLTPIHEKRIEHKNNMAYVPQHEIRAQLIRIFGPGNVDHTMSHPELLYDTRLEKDDPQYPRNGNGRPYYVACYMVGCTLRVRNYDGEPVAEFTEWHAEENAPLPNRGEAHAMAITSAQSYALRRAAISLGDAMGLHLYEGGSILPFVKGTFMIELDPDGPYYNTPVTKERLVADSLPEGPIALNPATGEVTGRPAPTSPPADLQAAFKQPSRPAE